MLTVDTFLKRGTSSQYLNFNFNSMARFGDIFLGANEDGLFTIGGDNDNGDDIAAFLETRTTDFGNSNPKKAREIVVGYEADGDLSVTVTAEDAESESITFDATKTGQQRRMKRVSRKCKGRYWKVKVANVDGADFSLDEIEMHIRPFAHNHRR